MARNGRYSSLSLPRSWSRRVRCAVLHAISLARLAVASARGRTSDGTRRRTRLQQANDRLRQEVALLREELRIKDARMEQIAPRRRAHYAPIEQMAILELRGARGWSAAQTADRFLVTPATIAPLAKAAG